MTIKVRLYAKETSYQALKWKDVFVPFVPREGDYILKVGYVKRVEVDTITQDILVVMEGNSEDLDGWTCGSPYPPGAAGDSMKYRDQTILSDVLRNSFLKERLRAFQEAAGDVCPDCGGRKFPKVPLEGPNSAGNYVHGDLLCKATSIWSRVREEFGSESVTRFKAAS